MEGALVPARLIAEAWRRRRRRLVAAAAAVAAIGVSVGVTLVRGLDGGAQAPAGAPFALTVTSFGLPGPPLAVAASHGSAWVVVETRASTATLVRLDARTGRRLGTYAIGRAGPDMGAVAAAGDVVWATAGGHVLRIDLARGTAGRAAVPGEASSVAVGAGSVWAGAVGASGGLVTRLDARTLRPQARIAVPAGPSALRFALGSVWLASQAGEWRIDPRTNRLSATTVPNSTPIDLAAAGGRVWVLEKAGFAVAADASGKPGRRVATPFSRPGRLAVGTGRIWMTDDCGCVSGRIAVLDAVTGRVLAERPIGETPVALALGGGYAWAATFGDGAVSRISLSP